MSFVKMDTNKGGLMNMDYFNGVVRSRTFLIIRMFIPPILKNNIKI